VSRHLLCAGCLWSRQTDLKTSRVFVIFAARDPRTATCRAVEETASRDLLCLCRSTSRRSARRPPMRGRQGSGSMDAAPAKRWRVRGNPARASSPRLRPAPGSRSA
jgi:hypothetical protein